MNNIGQNIKRVRENANLTQDELAAQLNVTRQAVSSWETGKTQPDIETLHKIASICGTDINEIIYGEAKPQPQTVVKHVTENKTVRSGITFGACLAIVISYTAWNSIPWAILHGLMGWIYVIYYVIKY